LTFSYEEITLQNRELGFVKNTLREIIPQAVKAEV
jgi:hypothetical protein